MHKILFAVLFFVSLVADAQFRSTNTYTVTSAGGTETLSQYQLADYIVVTPSGGAVTLANDYTLANASTPVAGRQWRVLVKTGFSLDGYRMLIFGRTYSTSMQATGADWEYSFVVNAAGVVNYTVRPIDFTATNIIHGSALRTGTVPRSAIDTTGAGRVWIGNASNATSSVLINGDMTVSSSGAAEIAAGAIVNADINASAAIARTKIASGTASHVLTNDGSGVLSSEAQLAVARGGTGINTAASTGFATVTSGTWAVGTLTDSKTFLVSFESGYQGDNKVRFPFDGTVTGMYAYVIKDIAGTDDGTVIAKNAAGTTMTNGTVTATASDPAGTAYSVSPSANNTFVANDLLYFTTAKTTAGGVILLTVTYTRTN